MIQLALHQASNLLAEFPTAWQLKVETSAGTESIQAHLSAGHTGTGAKQFLRHQAEIVAFPAQAPVATHSWPGIPVIVSAGPHVLPGLTISETVFMIGYFPKSHLSLKSS